MFRVRLVLLLFVVAVATTVRAAVFISPTNPTSSQVITARIEVSGLCSSVPTTTISGNSIRTDVFVTGCIAGPPDFVVERIVNFGPLAPGRYTYQVNQTPANILLGQFTIVVSDPGPGVPTLNPIGLAILAASIALLASFADLKT